jgi:hypothetical protein
MAPNAFLMIYGIGAAVGAVAAFGLRRMNVGPVAAAWAGVGLSIVGAIAAYIIVLVITVGSDPS